MNYFTELHVDRLSSTYSSNSSMFGFSPYNSQEVHLPSTSAASALIDPPAQATSPSPMSSMPTNQSFPGAYSFVFEFGKQPKDTKSTAWTYSQAANKLYAQKDAMCPIMFRINSEGLSQRLFIRALPIYSKPEHVQDVVKRCPNHVQAPESASIPHKEHFVWCEHQSAHYVHDNMSGRYAVILPYEAPAAGTSWSTYLFSFKCLNSCVGGPNRREMAIIFTLENANQEVLGRQCLDLRICACPGRDRKTEDSKHESSIQPNAYQGVGQNMDQQQLRTQMNVRRVHEIDCPAPKRFCGDQEIFTLQVRGQRNYEILSKIAESLEVAEALVSPEQRARFLQQRQHEEINTQYQQAPVVSAPQPVFSSFKFSSALNPGGRLIKQDLVDSTQPCSGGGINYTDSASSAPTVASWLKDLGLAAYVDNFHTAGLHSMNQLLTDEDFCMKDLENMMLTKPTVSQIWAALKGYRLQHGFSTSPQVATLKCSATEPSALPDSQSSQEHVSLSPGSRDIAAETAASLLQLSQGSSQDSSFSSISRSGSAIYRPRPFEVTRCSLKFTVLKKAPSKATAGAERSSQSDKAD